MKKNVLILAVATLLMVGCDKENSTPVATPTSDEIRVEASLGGTRATLTNFEAGDKMSLYAVEYSGEVANELQTAGNYLNNEEMVYNGTEWQSNRTLYWSENACDFYGFYPYQPVMPMSDFLFEIEEDQSRPKSEEELGGYEASDLMWAKAERVVREDGVVELEFTHMLSRVVVNIERGAKYEGELPEDIDVHIYNTITTANVDWRIGSLEPYLFSGRKTIKMNRIDADSFEAIVVPQFIERLTPLVEVTMGGIAYLLEASVSFRPGMQHTFTVTLNTSPDQEKIEINIDGDVGNW